MKIFTVNPAECDHDWTGDTYYIAKSGLIIYWHTYAPWRSYTSALRDELIHKYHNDIDDPIRESGVTCRKCGSMFNPLSILMCENQ